MCLIIFWTVIRSIDSIERIIIGFKKVFDVDFENRINNFIDSGKFDDAISECEKKLIKYPNHVDANWYLAKAYYYTNKNELSRQYFEKSIYLVPSWEESANAYIEKLDERK